MAVNVLMYLNYGERYSEQYIRVTIEINNKGKGKGHPRTGHKGPEGE